MKPYYYVYKYGDKAPRVRHSRLDQAEDEAMRLAKATPGASFEILQFLGVTQCTEPSTVWIDGVEQCLCESVDDELVISIARDCWKRSITKVNASTHHDKGLILNAHPVSGGGIVYRDDSMSHDARVKLADAVNERLSKINS